MRDGGIMRKIFTLICVGLALALSGCGGNRGDSDGGGASSSAVGNSETTATETAEQSVAERVEQPEFYTERYISSPEERLHRRQNRIEQHLASGGTSGGN